MKMSRVPASRPMSAMRVGDFSWHQPTDDTHDRVLRVCLPVMADLRKVGWKSPPETWHASIPVRAGEYAGEVWGWDGEASAPTLTPSVRAKTGSPSSEGEASYTVWHGYIDAGELRFLDADPPIEAEPAEPEGMTVAHLRGLLADLDGARIVEVSGPSENDYPVSGIFEHGDGRVLIMGD